MTERPAWTLRAATEADVEWLADLKAEVMHPDLERLGYWDPDWARQRFRDGFVPANTRVIVHDGRDVGSIAVRREPDADWVEHFYLSPTVHGQGIGGEVLAATLDAAGRDRPVRLAIDRGSRVQSLYERHGFVHVHDDDNGVDQIFERPSPR